MKKAILILLAAVCGVSTAAAQDLIVKADDSKIEAKVTEISPDAVRYKRFSNPDGPTYVLPVGDIHYIRYANGEEEYFRKVQTPDRELREPAALVTSQTGPVSGTAGEPHNPAALAATQTGPVSGAASEEPAQSMPATVYTSRPVPVRHDEQWSVGEFYDLNGVKGVVYSITADGRHGMLVSMTEIYLRWSEFEKPDLRLVGACDTENGAANMEKVAAYIAANNLSWDDFPAFKWCREQGEGWYLPSIDEMMQIGHAFNGGSRTSFNRKARTDFNDALKNNGGDRMDRLVNYFSSTESTKSGEKMALTSHMDIEPPYVVEIPKNAKFLVRAVHKF